MLSYDVDDRSFNLDICVRHYLRQQKILELVEKSVSRSLAVTE